MLNHKNRNAVIESIFYNLDWIIFAIALTLIFLVFQMRAYTIPTGSMADTLKGAHFRLRCKQCGYRYDYDFLPRYYKMAENTTPNVNIPVLPGQPRCSSCGYYRQSAQKMPVIKGDRIFVLKCIYQFFEPKRWDVVVFQPPLNPKINYIKRMVGLPGETVEIIDGDVYIDGKIARKPKKVQEELWMPIYNNDYQPVNPNVGRFNGHPWTQPFKNTSVSTWDLDARGPTVFALNSPHDQVNTIIYNTNIGNDFRAAYAYDYHNPRYPLPLCSDLKIGFDVDADSKGSIGAGLSKYGIHYMGWVDITGQLVLEKIDINGVKTLLVRKSFQALPSGLPVPFNFANVDHQLIVEFGTEKLEYDLGPGADDAGQRQVDIMPEAKIFGAGDLTISNINIFRDMYYFSSLENRKILRAAEGDPFQLDTDEFFVLGDNSPASLDSRFWDKPGLGNNNRQYRQGIVPREYLVGKAFIVFWPGAQKPFARSKFKMIPYIGGLKVIEGGGYKWKLDDIF